MDGAHYPSYCVDANSLWIEEPCEQLQVHEIASILHHHGSRARRLRRRRRGAHSSRPNLPLLLVLVLVLLRATTSPRQLASSPRHGPTATETRTDSRAPITSQSSPGSTGSPPPTRCTREPGGGGAAAEREEGKDSGAETGPGKRIGAGGGGEPSTRAQRRASDQRSEGEQ